LSSRIPYGERVTAEKLAQIDQAEIALYEAGFRQVRVRHHGDVARIEVPASDLPRFFTDGLNIRVAGRLKSIGFKHVAVDLQGYRSGSMNEALPAVASVSAVRRSLPVIQG
jgi:uncharacterized protein